MAIKFKVIEKGQPGVPEGGVKKFYASTQSSGKIGCILLSSEKLTRLEQRASHISDS